MSPRRLLAVAVHEASHVVAARDQDVEVLGCSIQPRRLSGRLTSGQVFYGDRPDDPNGDNFIRMAIVARAGAVAQIQFGDDADLIKGGAERDDEAIEHALAAYAKIHGFDTLCDREREIGERTIRQYVEDHANRIVSENWPAIEAIAAALLDQRNLLADQIETIIAEAGPVHPVLAAARPEHHALCHMEPDHE